MDISKFIRGVPDFPKKGILFYDITPLMLNSEAYSQAIDEMAAKISETWSTRLNTARTPFAYTTMPYLAQTGLRLWTTYSQQGALRRRCAKCAR